MTELLCQEQTYKFHCEGCDYKCCKQSVFNKHLLTQKHRIIAKTFVKGSGLIIVKKEYVCKCGKIYKHSQSLYNHKKKCDYKEKKLLEHIETTEDLKEIIIKLLNNNELLQKLLQKLLIQQQLQLDNQQKQKTTRIERSFFV